MERRAIARLISEQLTMNSEQFQTPPVIANTVESETNTVSHYDPANGGESNLWVC